MFLHYLKIAFRNLRKYKTQNAISILGLAVGFVCFSLSTIWIRYEMSYDSFHPKADRIYLVQLHHRKWDTVNADASEVNSSITYPLGRYLKSSFPEIEDVCSISPVEKENGVSIIYTDTAFFNMFDLSAPPKGFFVRGFIMPAMVTEDFTATEYLKEELAYDIQAVTPHWPQNTNIPFQVISPLWVNYSETELTENTAVTFRTYVLLKEGVDLPALEEKLDKMSFGESPVPVSITLMPIRKQHYADPANITKADIKFNHIVIFSLSGLLVILCALFNHTTLFISQIQMRMREFALRKVNGSSNGQIIKLLYLEFLLVLVVSLAIGSVFLALCISYFKEYAGIGSNSIHIFMELLIYGIAIIIFAFLSGLFPILHFRRQTLSENIHRQHVSKNKNRFRKVSLSLQLTISIGLLFCALVILKQMKYLINTDLGIDRHHVASVYTKCCSLNDSYYIDKLRQIAGVTDVLPVKSFFLEKIRAGTLKITMYKADGQEEKFESSSFYYIIHVDNHFFDFFNIDMIEGEKFPNQYQDNPFVVRSLSDQKVVVNETAAKGLEGKVIGQLTLNGIIVGIAKDFYITPTAKVQPSIIHYSNSLEALAYRYEDGQRQQTQQAITKWLRKELPDKGEFEIEFTYMEDVFEAHFKSERALLALLSIMTGVCILISIFGVYSLTSLTCEQRRKEIAIRKVNGAEVTDIMNIFFKEYSVLLAIAALVAFPAGYIIMKRWLEGYVKQTSMDAWLFVLIFLVVFAVIVLTIVSMVWKAANQNPAEVVKSE